MSFSTIPVFYHNMCLSVIEIHRENPIEGDTVKVKLFCHGWVGLHSLCFPVTHGPLRSLHHHGPASCLNTTKPERSSQAQKSHFTPSQRFNLTLRRGRNPIVLSRQKQLLSIETVRSYVLTGPQKGAFNVCLCVFYRMTSPLKICTLLDLTTYPC